MSKIHVWHNLNGEIIAIGRSFGTAKCLPISGENQFIVEVEVPDADISSLHRTHLVDPVKKVLVPVDKTSGKYST